MKYKSFKKLLIISICGFSSLIMHNVLASQIGIEAFENQDIEKAKKIFTLSLSQNENDAVALHYLSKISLSEGELDDAEDYIIKAQKFAPKNAAVFFDAARIMGAQAQDSSMFSAPGYAKDALKAFKRAAELEPKTLKYRQGLMAFYIQAPGFLGGDEALAFLEAKAISEIDDVAGFIAFADVYQATDEETLLKSHYASVEEKYFDNVSVLYARGMYFQSQQQYTKAVSDFEIVQKLEPKEDEESTVYAALYQIGRSSVLSKSHIDKGIKALHGYIESAPSAKQLPEKAWAKYRLGLLYKENGDKKTAIKLYKEAKSETQDKVLLKELKKVLKKRR